MNPGKNIILFSPGKEELQSGPPPAWLEQLKVNLGLVLKKYTGEDLQAFTPDVKEAAEALAGADFLVLVMHPSYEASPAYGKMLNGLAGGREAGTGNVIRIGTSPGVDESLPEVIKNAVSIEMFSPPAEGEKQEWLTEGSDIYWSRLLDLAAEIRSRAAENGQQPSGSEDAAHRQAGPVYLAQASPDMARNRNIIKRELVEHGFRVVPYTDLSILKDELKSHVQNLVDKSCMAIHLLGNAYGREISDERKSIAEVQLQYVTDYLEAIENDPVYSSKELNRLIWIDPEFSPEDPRQEELINQLKRNIENLHRTEIIQTPLELFKALIIKRLKQTTASIHQAANQAAGDDGFFYIIHAADDQDEAREIVGGLESGGVKARMLDYSSDQRSLLNDHKQYLQECRGAIIYYGRPNRFWLLSKAMDLLKAPGMGRTTGLETRRVIAGKADSLEDYPLPEGISLMHEPDLSKAVANLLKTLKH
jgi:hypothetical protein